MFILRKRKMIRVGRNVHDPGCSPFKSNHQFHNNNKKVPRKTTPVMLRCNGQMQTPNHEPVAVRSRSVTKLRYSPKSNSIINNNQASPPLKEFQFNQNHIRNNATDQQDQDHSVSAIDMQNLFAGSKFVCPSPKDLPRPPAHWIICQTFVNGGQSISNDDNLAEGNGADSNDENGKGGKKKKQIEKNCVSDLSHDSAILLIGSTSMNMNASPILLNGLKAIP